MVTHDPRARLLELTSERGVSLSGLSELIGRNSTYLQQFIRKGSPRKLEENDRRILAEFFAVQESELGGSPRGGARRARLLLRRPIPKWRLRPWETRLRLALQLKERQLAEAR